MPFVIREHANLLERLNGVAFTAHAAGSISAEIDESAAALFLAVPGHRLAEDHEVPGYVAPVVDAPKAAPKAARKGAAAAAAAAALIADAEGSGSAAEPVVTDGEAPAVTEGESPAVAASDAASAADTPLF